jgi:hypothetical protein
MGPSWRRPSQLHGAPRPEMTKPRVPMIAFADQIRISSAYVAASLAVPSLQRTTARRVPSDPSEGKVLEPQDLLDDRAWRVTARRLRRTSPAHASSAGPSVREYRTPSADRYSSPICSSAAVMSTMTGLSRRPGSLGRAIRAGRRPRRRRWSVLRHGWLRLAASDSCQISSPIS